MLQYGVWCHCCHTHEDPWLGCPIIWVSAANSCFRLSSYLDFIINSYQKVSANFNIQIFKYELMCSECNSFIFTLPQVAACTGMGIGSVWIMPVAQHYEFPRHFEMEPWHHFSCQSMPQYSLWRSTDSYEIISFNIYWHLVCSAIFSRFDSVYLPLWL